MMPPPLPTRAPALHLAPLSLPAEAGNTFPGTLAETARYGLIWAVADVRGANRRIVSVAEASLPLPFTPPQERRAVRLFSSGASTEDGEATLARGWTSPVWRRYPRLFLAERGDTLDPAGIPVGFRIEAVGRANFPVRGAKPFRTPTGWVAGNAYRGDSSLRIVTSPRSLLYAASLFVRRNGAVVRRSFLWRGSPRAAPAELRPPSGFVRSNVWAVNARGDACGTVGDTKEERGVVWRNGSPTLLPRAQVLNAGYRGESPPVPPGWTLAPEVLTDDGLVLGGVRASKGGDWTWQTWIWDGRTLRWLDAAVPGPPGSPPGPPFVRPTVGLNGRDLIAARGYLEGAFFRITH